MEEKFLFCVSVLAGDHKVYGPEWKEAESGKTLIDLFVQACGNKILGQQVQVLVSKDRSFLEAAVVQVCTPLATLTENSQSYIQFLLKAENLKYMLDLKPDVMLMFANEKDGHKKNEIIMSSFTEKSCSLTNWKNQFNASYETFRDKYVPSSPKESWNEATSLHNLTTRPSFENMSVQEICDEIKRIKTHELSKSKLSSWVTNKSTVNHTANIANVKNVEPSNAQQVVASPTTPRKKLSSKPLVSIKSPSSTKVLGSSISKQTRTTTNSPRTSSPKQPISDRLSALAKPRRRFSEPSREISSVPKAPSKPSKSASKISAKEKKKKISSPLASRAVEKKPEKIAGRKNKVNGTFVKKPLSAALPTEPYFVEIFTKVDEMKQHSNERIDTWKSVENISIDSLFSTIHRQHLSAEANPELTKEISEKTSMQEICDGTAMESKLIKVDLLEKQMQLEDNLLESTTNIQKPTSSPVFVSRLKRSCSSPSILENGSNVNSDSLETDSLQMCSPESVKINTQAESVLSTTETEWSNFRGIKFTTAKEQLNRTFVVERKDIDHNMSLDEKELSLAIKRKSLTPSPEICLPSSETSDENVNGEFKMLLSVETVKSPEKSRKHWGRGIEGMDNIIVSSLHAFSTELRTTSETVATNIRMLYEEWQVKNEGECTSPLNELKSLIPKKSPKHTKEESEQQGIAAVFRNMRKIEIKLKTIEQATLTMVQHVKDGVTQSGESNARTTLSRTKSFKWRDLKTSVRNKSRVKSWSDKKDNTSSDSDD